MEIQAIRSGAAPAVRPVQETAPQQAEARPAAVPAPRYDRYVPGDAAPEGGAPESVPARTEGEALTTVNTDQVDKEVTALKKELEQLERERTAARDEQRAGELEQELSQVELELSQKDSEAYRRQHAQVTQGPAGL